MSKIYSRTTPNNTKWVLNQKFIFFYSHIFETTLLNDPIQCDWIFLLQIWRKKNQKAHFEHPQNFWKLYQFNVWSAYEFLSLFHFLARWVINLSLIYGHLWWYCSTSDKHVSGNEKEHLTFLAPWQWLKTLAQSARIKTLLTMKSERFSNGTGTLEDRTSISHALISCVICSSKPSIVNSH